ncbi:MAG: phosphotransferase, partial [Gammaproteobacteria bacterium]
MHSDFVDLAQNPSALLEVLTRLGLAEPDETPAVCQLTGGVSSNICTVSLRRGPVCVKQALPKLKVAADWRAPTSRVFAEIAWLQTAATVIPSHVPAVLGVDERHSAFVMEYLPPNHYCNWKAELMAGRISAELGKEVGDILARMHAGTATDPALAQRFANDATFFALRLDPYLLESARQHPDLAQRLAEIVRATQSHPFALVHGDVSPKNILLGSRGAVLLDAECAWYGDPAFDLAFLLNHTLLKWALLSTLRAGLEK